MLNSEFDHFMRTAFKNAIFFAYLIRVSEILEVYCYNNLPSESLLGTCDLVNL